VASGKWFRTRRGVKLRACIPRYFEISGSWIFEGELPGLINSTIAKANRSSDKRSSTNRSSTAFSLDFRNPS